MHHVDARVAQRRQIARRQAAVHVVDRVGDHQHLQLRHRALARQQRVAQLGRQLAMRLGVDARRRAALLNRKKSSTRYSRASPISFEHRHRRSAGAPPARRTRRRRSHPPEKLHLVRAVCRRFRRARARRRAVACRDSRARPASQSGEKTIEKQPPQCRLRGGAVGGGDGSIGVSSGSSAIQRF